MSSASQLYSRSTVLNVEEEQSIDLYRVEANIGRGAFGEVSKVTKKSTN